MVAQIQEDQLQAKWLKERFPRDHFYQVGVQTAALMESAPIAVASGRNIQQMIAELEQQHTRAQYTPAEVTKPAQAPSSFYTQTLGFFGFRKNPESTSVTSVPPKPGAK